MNEYMCSCSFTSFVFIHKEYNMCRQSCRGDISIYAFLYFSSMLEFMMSKTSCMNTLVGLPLRSSTVIGLCIFSEIVPGETDFALRENTSKEPLMVSGTMGNPISFASMNAPLLKVPISPV